MRLCRRSICTGFLYGNIQLSFPCAYCFNQSFLLFWKTCTAMLKANTWFMHLQRIKIHGSNKLGISLWSYQRSQGSPRPNGCHEAAIPMNTTSCVLITHTIFQYSLFPRIKQSHIRSLFGCISKLVVDHPSPCTLIHASILPLLKNESLFVFYRSLSHLGIIYHFHFLILSLTPISVAAWTIFSPYASSSYYAILNALSSNCSCCVLYIYASMDFKGELHIVPS